MVNLNTNNKKNSCEDHYKAGLTGNAQHCTTWNAGKSSGTVCPPGGGVNGLCSGGGDPTCYSQNQYFKAASFCRGLDDVYFAENNSKEVRGVICPEGAILTGVSNDATLQCRKLIPNAFDSSDSEKSGDTIRSTEEWGKDGKMWSSGPVRSNLKADLKICPGRQFATGTGLSLGCKSVRQSRESFIKKSSENHQ